MNLRTTGGNIFLEQRGTRLRVTNQGYFKSTAVGGRVVRKFQVAQVLALGPKQNFQVNDIVAILVKMSDAKSPNIRMSLNFPWETTDIPIENLTRGGGFGGPGGLQTTTYHPGDVLSPGLPAGPFLTGSPAGPTGHPGGVAVEHISDSQP